MGDLDHIFDDTLFRFHEEYLQPHFIPQKNTRSFIHLKSEENIATVRNSPGITILVGHGVSLQAGHKLNQVLRQFGTRQYSMYGQFGTTDPGYRVYSLNYLSDKIECVLILAEGIT